MKPENRIEKIGIDLGNTLIVNRQPLPDALQVTGMLRKRFGEHIYIISRVNEEQEKRARAFVTSEIFVQTTGIPFSRVHFCRERHEKAPIARELGLTHFIDDRPEVMSHMPFVRDRILFNPDSDDLMRFFEEVSGPFVVRSWLEVKTLLIS